MNTPRIWSRKILKVLKAFVKHPGSELFGITGDIDRLGIFVAHHGRPEAENLVDVLNRLVGFLCTDYIGQRRQYFPAFCFIPSGEEIFAIGVGYDQGSIEDFFFLCKQEANSFLHRHSPIEQGECTISFGCAILTDAVPQADIEAMIRLTARKKIAEASLAYLKVMLVIREVLARDLDSEKFSILRLSKVLGPIFLRNVVYAQLLEYKERTREMLLGLDGSLPDNTEFCEQLSGLSLSQRYGFEPPERERLKRLLRDIEARLGT